LRDNKKTWLPWITAVAVVVVFGLLMAGLFLYPAIKANWLLRRLSSAGEKELEAAVKEILSHGPAGTKVLEDYFSRDNTGWGKLSDGLAARVAPDEQSLKPNKPVELTLEVINITGTDLSLNPDNQLPLSPEIIGVATHFRLEADWLNKRGPPGAFVVPAGSIVRRKFKVHFWRYETGVVFIASYEGRPNSIDITEPNLKELRAFFRFYGEGNRRLLDTNPVTFSLE